MRVRPVVTSLSLVFGSCLFACGPSVPEPWAGVVPTDKLDRVRNATTPDKIDLVYATEGGVAQNRATSQLAAVVAGLTAHGFVKVCDTKWDKTLEDVRAGLVKDGVRFWAEAKSSGMESSGAFVSVFSEKAPSWSTASSAVWAADCARIAPPTATAGRPACDKLAAKLEGCIGTMPLKAEAKQLIKDKNLETINGAGAASDADCVKVLAAIKGKLGPLCPSFSWD